MTQVIYDGDERYPGPKAHPAPPEITGMPTQRELDAQARIFTWGELKEIVQSGDLELLMRNKKMQARYDEWMMGMKAKYGSTEAYLTQARLPWAKPSDPSPTYDLHPHPQQPHLDIPPSPTSPKDPEFNAYQHPPLSKSGEPWPNTREPDVEGLTISLNEIDMGLKATRHSRTPSITISPSDNTPSKFPLLPEAISITPQLQPGSGASTPSSVGFVSLNSLNLVNGKLRRSRPGTPSKTATAASNSPESVGAAADVDARPGPSVDDEDGDDEEPVYLRWEGWLNADKYAVLPNDWPYNIPYGVRHYCVWSRIPIAHPDLVDYDPEAWSKIESEGLGGFTGITPLFRRRRFPPSPSPTPSSPVSGATTPAAGRTKSLGKLDKDEWYAVDVDSAGPEARRWAGVEYECKGGQEVGKMVRGLWDERGWECLWFVNPPRLQSVPGFSHFHVFARRKTPEEIDAAESAMASKGKSLSSKNGL